MVPLEAADHGRRPPLPARGAVRAQHGGRAGPHRLRRAAARDPRLLRARHQRDPVGRRVVAGGGDHPGAADRLLRRPAPAGPDRHRWRVAVGWVLDPDRPRDQPVDARDSPRRRRIGPGRQRSGAQLAARRLLRHPRAPPGLLGAPLRQRARPVPGPVLGGAHRLRLRLAVAVHHLLGCNRLLRPPGLPAPRAGAGSVRAAGRGCVGRGGQHRGGATVLGRVVPHHLAGAEPPAHLLRPAVPRRCRRRPAHPRRPLLRGGVQPRRAGPRLRSGRHPGGCPVGRVDRGDPRRDPPDGPGPRLRAALPGQRGVCRGAGTARLRHRAQHRRGHRRQRPGGGLVLPAHPRDLRGALAGGPGQGAGLRLRGTARCGSCPAC